MSEAPNLLQSPNTTYVTPPLHNQYQGAVWLLGRHERLRELTHRCNIVRVEDGALFIDLDALNAAFVELAEVRMARAAFADEHPCPIQRHGEAISVYDGRCTEWESHLPTCSGDVARILATLSSHETSLLRLLAMLSHGERIGLAARDFDGLDDESAAIVMDW